MLEQLTVTNYAIIDHLRVELEPGLTTITGETGAGKSILLGALKLALGERASAEAIRTGEERASVEAVFGALPQPVLATLQDDGFLAQDDEGQLILRRELLAGGASRSFINGRAVTLAQMRDLAAQLVDIHGQGEHTSLFSNLVQLRLLDSFGGLDDEVAQYRRHYRTMRDAEARMRELAADAGDAERRRAYLEFQVNEIAAAALTPGEDEALEQERRLLANTEKLGAACVAACDLLYEGESTETPAGALIAAAAKALEEVAALDPALQELAACAGELRFAAEDLAARVREHMARVQADPQRLAAVEDRLHLIHSLKRKYGITVAMIIEAGETFAAELSALQNRDEEIEEARSTLALATFAALESARDLTAERVKAAREFERRVGSEMRGLELPKAAFAARVAPRGAPDELSAPPGGPAPPAAESSPQRKDVPVIPGAAALGPDGADSAEFLVALNPGEEARPLRKVASGGEIARIMLAIKSVLAGRDAIPTLIFDEIDVGISGEAAARVGERLAELSASHQVLCITHLPQVAARGDQHLAAGKRVVQGRTRAELRKLAGADRVAALAQMLSGRDVDEASLRYAKKLLSRAK